MRRSWLFVALTCLALAASAVGPMPARAAVLKVTRFDDPAPDGYCGPGQGDSDCSLREAIIAANSSPDTDIIVLAAGNYVLGTDPATKPTGDDAGLRGDLDVRGSVFIRGAGMNATAVNANYIDRAFDISCAQTCDVELRKLTVRRGVVNGWGGAIQVNTAASRLEVVDSRVIESWSIGNHAGGAIENDGLVHVLRSNIYNNHAYAGGGIANFGTLSVDASFIGYNQSNHIGGGIYNAGGREALIDNSTVARNVATDCGGGIMTNGAAAVSNSTVVANRALGGPVRRGCRGAGGIDWSGHIYTQLRNTIVAFNGTDCAGSASGGAPTIESQGYNLDSDKSCNLVKPTDLPGIDPKLSSLGFYGGPTWVYGLTAASPAVDSGVPGACPARDQRGVARPQDGNGDKKTACDRGAFERRPGAAP